MRVIKASELGVYLYCKRAWSYQHQGVASQNQTQMEKGTAYHQKHGQQVLLAKVFRVLGIIFLLAAIAILAVLIFQQATG